MRDMASRNQPVILVVDDNADMRTYLMRLLADEYRVITAGDGEDALQKARRLLPALVLADIMMPVMSGHDLLKAIHCDDALRATPVILLTARAGTEARVESLEAGADDYVSKPFNEEELLARIKNQLRIHAQERELEAKATQLQHLYRSWKPSTQNCANSACGSPNLCRSYPMTCEHHSRPSTDSSTTYWTASADLSPISSGGISTGSRANSAGWFE